MIHPRAKFGGEVEAEYRFGSPLGSFQAIQHHCANMYRNLEACRLLIYQAATRLGEGKPAEREVAMAKASEVVSAITQLAHQIHGAVGYYRWRSWARACNRRAGFP